MDFSIMLYRCPGTHFAHNGQTYDYTVANSEGERSELKGQGWYESLADAVDDANGVFLHEAEGDDNAPPTREELEKMATDLGIKFDGRTGDASLLRKIEEAVEGKE